MGINQKILAETFAGVVGHGRDDKADNYCYGCRIVPSAYTDSLLPGSTSNRSHVIQVKAGANGVYSTFIYSDWIRVRSLNEEIHSISRRINRINRKLSLASGQHHRHLDCSHQAPVVSEAGPGQLEGCAVIY